jgi:adenylyltransferase/sulfurtransferase
VSEGRYSRQALFRGIGEAGQRRIAAAHVVIVGCGAIGSTSADRLARAGVGRLTLIDRDFVELSNLQRQTLYTEEDARRRLPKVVAAQRRLGEINSGVAVTAQAADVTARTVARLVGRPEVVVDGTDNFETRFLLNDYCVREGVPWVYGGAVGGEGRAMAVMPGRTACLRCAVDLPPPAGGTPTCDHVGVLGATTGAVGALQSAAALRILVGEGVESRVTVLNVWTGEARSVALQRRADCPACARREFPFLDGRSASCAVTLCGRNLVQITPAADAALDLGALAVRLGEAEYNGFLLTVREGELEMTIFPDGRALVKGTQDESRARAFYARRMG